MSPQDLNPRCKHKLPLHNHACGGPIEEASPRKRRKNSKKAICFLMLPLGILFSYNSNSIFDLTHPTTVYFFEAFNC